MIIEYYRPATIEEALELIGRVGVPVYPMGGGTALERSASRPLSVVDLQDLQLSGMRERGNQLEVGATTRLQAFLEQPGISDGMRQAIAREASYNLRQVATVDYVNQRIPSEQRATVLSFRALLFALVVAGVEPALGAIADVWSLRMAFLATALFGLLALGPLLAAWRRAEAREEREAAGEPAAAVDQGPAGDGETV